MSGTNGPRLPVEVTYEAPRDPEHGDTDERWSVVHDDDHRLLGRITLAPGAYCVYVWSGEERRILTSVDVERGRAVALVQAVAFLAALDAAQRGETLVWWRTPVAQIGGAS